MNTLLIRSALGFLFLILVLALMLFLPAGTLDFWQAWVYLAVWALCVIPITVYLARADPHLLENRVKAGPVSETRRSQQLIQAMATLCFLLLFLVPGLDRRFGWSQVPDLAVVLADFLVAAGFLFVFFVFRENTYTSATIEVEEGQKVISTGPYALVRHPMYAGAGLLVLATPVALGSWVGLPFAALLMVVIAYRALDEETLLEKDLAGYAEYKRKVHWRIIPGVW